MVVREKLSRFATRYIAKTLVYNEETRKDQGDEKMIERKIWNTTKEMRKQRRTLQVVIGEMESFLKLMEEERKRDPSKKARDAGTAAKVLKEHEDDKEAQVNQM